MTHLRKKLSSWLRRQSRIRNTVRELNALNDRDLADIGLYRCDIGRVAHEVVL
jgi:uncharacterized protein YjiS (DUF1127 family)